MSVPGQPAPVQKEVYSSVVGTIEPWGAPTPPAAPPAQPQQQQHSQQFASQQQQQQPQFPSQQQQGYPPPLHQPPYQPQQPQYNQPSYPPPGYQQPYPPQMQQGAFYGQAGPPPPMVIMQAPQTQVVVVSTWWGVYPQRTQCPRCTAQIMTNVISEPGCGAFLVGSLICVLGGWLGCCLIPCCVESCQDQTHSCPNCNSILGRRAMCDN